MLDELGNKISGLKMLANQIGDQINGSNKTITKIIPKAVIVIDDIENKTNEAKEVVKKLRNPCRKIFDITLLMILLGLICVLISIIRHKYF